MSLDAYFTALSAAQSGAKFTPDVQSKANAIANVDALKVAVQAVLAGDDKATVEGEQAAALKAGFEFAAELVKMLNSEPGVDDKLALYGHYKRGLNVEVPKPGMFALEAKAKYGAWEKTAGLSAEKAQAVYIEKVNGHIEKIGTRD